MKKYDKAKNKKLQEDIENGTDDEDHEAQKINKFDNSAVSMSSIDEPGLSRRQTLRTSGNLAMSDFNLNLKTKEKYVDLRDEIIKNYGVQMEIPSFSFRDGLLVPG